MNTKILSVLSDTKQAYADCWGNKPFEQTMNVRNLNFKASDPVSRHDAKEIMAQAVPHGYNEFHAQLIDRLPEDSKITIAREGSVCLYVETPSEMPSRMVMLCDELDALTNNLFRLWWD